MYMSVCYVYVRARVSMADMVICDDSKVNKLIGPEFIYKYVAKNTYEWEMTPTFELNSTYVW